MPLPTRQIWKAAVCEEKSNSLLYPEAQLFAFASPNLEAEFQHLKDWILLNLEWLPLYLTFQNQIFRKSSINISGSVFHCLRINQTQCQHSKKAFRQIWAY